MSHLYPYCKQIDLHVEGRIQPEDAQRQEATAKEILVRLKNQPGVVLADEVGMGKTFVALAVAMSVALANRGCRPVVVMVPPSLQEKWPRDFSLFTSRCLPEDLRKTIRHGTATRAEEFLKYLDDPPSRRCAIIFVTHGAMSLGLSDRWVMLALIRQALRHRRGVEDLKAALCKILGSILKFKWMDLQFGSDLWAELLREHPGNWLSVLQKWGVDPEGYGSPDTNDDPVPRAVWEVLSRLNTDELFSKLKGIPKKKNDSFDARTRSARKIIQAELRLLWKQCIREMKFRLPLLILDEAHHLKNENTRLASLFRCNEAADDMDEVSRGALGEVFERMLFLTATPFQLGHSELCSVLERFSGIAWNSRIAPSCGKDGFLNEINVVRKSLDVAQEAALRLDDAWSLLRPEHLNIGGQYLSDLDEWWLAVKANRENATELQRVLDYYRTAHNEMRKAEKVLRPWVLRHLKPRQLPTPHQSVSRRTRLPGRAIVDEGDGSTGGLVISNDAVVPFLLAARATAFASNNRALFAEGLASSYEAFLDTHQVSKSKEDRRITDEDSDDEPSEDDDLGELTWYLSQLDSLMPRDFAEASMAHPKIAATAQRVVDTWLQGEKVLVFCHFVATGRALRRAISHAIRGEIIRLGVEKLGCPPTAVFDELERLGNRFLDQDSPIRRSCDAEVLKILQSYPTLGDRQTDLCNAARRIVRTPSFLVRFFSLRDGRLRKSDMLEALHQPDQSGMTLSSMLNDFFEFLQKHCDDFGRTAFINAVCRIQTGSHVGGASAKGYADDELQGDDAESLLPNVRLVNGATVRETRQRLMLAFNTPFYPEVMVASSVMAEGVDLHLNCRHVIHHDLCWNPSTLEQRTGRVDRVGAKAERCGRSIHVYLPYLSETQDEKMFRVVTDRERWFSVVMGEKFDLIERSTEKLATRIPLPETVARSLALRLEVVDTMGATGA